MKPPPSTLEQVQRWMQAVVTHPGGVEAGTASPDALAAIELGPRGLEGVILPSRTQTSAERLAVYAHAYLARLLHCLRDLFPACRHAVGDDAFDDFALGYLQLHPPTSYTLGNLANRFVEYLNQSREHQDLAGDSRESEVDTWSRFVVELARLEQTIDEVFDGPGTERLAPLGFDQLAAIAPEQWSQVRLYPAPCLRVLSFEFPTNDYFAAFRRGQSPELPDPRPTHLAISRRDYVVRRYPIDATQQVLLSAILGGATLGEALAGAARLQPDGATLALQLTDWFAFWSEQRFFTAIVPSPSRNRS